MSDNGLSIKLLLTCSLYSKIYTISLHHSGDVKNRIVAQSERESIIAFKTSLLGYHFISPASIEGILNDGCLAIGAYTQLLIVKTSQHTICTL